jgi:hypothetical protein
MDVAKSADEKPSQGSPYLVHRYCSTKGWLWWLIPTDVGIPMINEPFSMDLLLSLVVLFRGVPRLLAECRGEVWGGCMGHHGHGHRRRDRGGREEGGREERGERQIGSVWWKCEFIASGRTDATAKVPRSGVKSEQQVMRGRRGKGKNCATMDDATASRHSPTCPKTARRRRTNAHTSEFRRLSLPIGVGRRGVAWRGVLLERAKVRAFFAFPCLVAALGGCVRAVFGDFHCASWDPIPGGSSTPRPGGGRT